MTEFVLTLIIYSFQSAAIYQSRYENMQDCHKVGKSFMELEESFNGFGGDGVAHYSCEEVTT